MSTATELLRRALGFWDNPESDRFGTEAAKVFDEIRKFLAAESEAEPIGFEFIKPGKELFRYLNDEDCIEIKVDLPRYPSRSRFYPHRPEPEAEPVAWTNQDELNALGTDVTCYMYSEPMMCENNIPLYTNPSPARKPMTEEEIKLHCIESEMGLASRIIFRLGIRYAEKHHGIIDPNRSPATTDTNNSIDLQSKCRGDKP